MKKAVRLFLIKLKAQTYIWNYVFDRIIDYFIINILSYWIYDENIWSSGLKLAHNIFA